VLRHLDHPRLFQLPVKRPPQVAGIAGESERFRHRIKQGRKIRHPGCHDRHAADKLHGRLATGLKSRRISSFMRVFDETRTSGRKFTGINYE